ALHTTVVVRLAAGQIVDVEQTLQHRDDVAEAHERSGNPDAPLHRHAVPGRELARLVGNAEHPREVVEGDGALLRRAAVAGRIDQRRLAVARIGERLTVRGEQRPALVQRTDLQDADPEALDDAAWILIHDVPGRPRQLDAVAVHHVGDRRAVD